MELLACKEVGCNRLAEAPCGVGEAGNEFGLPSPLVGHTFVGPFFMPFASPSVLPTFTMYETLNLPSQHTMHNIPGEAVPSPEVPSLTPARPFHSRALPPVKHGVRTWGSMLAITALSAPWTAQSGNSQSPGSFSLSSHLPVPTAQFCSHSGILALSVESQA